MAENKSWGRLMNANTIATGASVLITTVCMIGAYRMGCQSGVNVTRNVLRNRCDAETWANVCEVMKPFEK